MCFRKSFETKIRNLAHEPNDGAKTLPNKVEITKGRRLYMPRKSRGSLGNKVTRCEILKTNKDLRTGPILVFSITVKFKYDP